MPVQTQIKLKWTWSTFESTKLCWTEPRYYLVERLVVINLSWKGSGCQFCSGFADQLPKGLPSVNKSYDVFIHQVVWSTKLTGFIHRLSKLKVLEGLRQLSESQGKNYISCAQVPGRFFFARRLLFKLHQMKGSCCLDCINCKEDAL